MINLVTNDINHIVFLVIIYWIKGLVLTNSYAAAYWHSRRFIYQCYKWPSGASSGSVVAWQ